MSADYSATIEVTQAIQDLAHSVPLVAEKTTVVRVFVDGPPGIEVSATLSVTHSNRATASVRPENTIQTETTPLNTRRIREDASGSLNFVLPGHVTVPGKCAITVKSIEHVADWKPRPVSVKPVTVEFIAVPPLRLTVVGFRYQWGNPPASHAPSPRDFELIGSWLTRAYPIPRVNMKQFIANETVDPFTAGEFNAKLRARRRTDLATGGDPQARYYGVVADSGRFITGLASVPKTGPSPEAVATGPAGPNRYAWDTDGSFGDWYAGHELGHTLGREHPGGCDGQRRGATDNHKNPRGRLSSDNAGLAGFDVGDDVRGIRMAVYPGLQWHCMMSYCPQVWICAESYMAIMQQLVREEANPPRFGLTL